MAIVDINGVPFDRQVLAGPQSARVGSVAREWQTHPGRGLTPAKIATILRDAELGILRNQADLFADMEERDGHIAAELVKRKNAVIGLDWSLECRPDASAREKKAAANLEAWVRDELDIEDLLFDTLDGLGHGYSCLELQWKKRAAGWIPTPTHQDPAWFCTDQADRNTLRLRSDAAPNGEPLWPFGWICHVHRARSGYLARVGLHRSLVWPYLFRNYAARDWAEFLEIFGIPIRVGKYPASAGKPEQDTLLKAVTQLGHNAAGIIPEGMMIELIQATGGAGGGDAFERMVAWCERTVSKCILGGTLTSETGGVGSQALGRVHNEVRMDLRNSDARQVAQSLSGQLLYPIAVINGLFPADRVPVWRFDTSEADDLGVIADALPKLVSVGAQVPVSWVNERLKIPVPDGTEPVLRAGAAAPALAPNAPPAVAAASVPPVELPADYADTQVGRLAATADAIVAADLVAPLRAALDASIAAGESLEEFQRKLPAIAAAIRVERLGDALGEAMLAAELAGRWELERGD